MASDISSSFVKVLCTNKIGDSGNKGRVLWSAVLPVNLKKSLAISCDNNLPLPVKNIVSSSGVSWLWILIISPLLWYLIFSKSGSETE